MQRWVRRLVDKEMELTTEEADKMQEWAGMDGAIAWHLIDRNADNWNEAGEMMNAWLRANGGGHRVPSEDKIAELEAKNERLRMALADTEALEIGTAERCAKLTRQRGEYKADAERYRWLKSQKGLNLSSCGGSWIKGNIKFNASHRLCANDTAYAPYETLDEAIDAAIAAAPELGD